MPRYVSGRSVTPVLEGTEREMNVLGIRDGKRGEQVDVVKRMFKLVLLYDYLLLITCAGENDE